MSTGTTTRAAASAFHSDDPEETTSYRSLSVLAIVAFLLGLASPLCFGAVLLLVIPIAGIVVAILALRQIATSDGQLAGRWAATAGLIMCVVFATAPGARAYVLRSMRTSQAKEFADTWLKSLLAGDTEHAFRLTVESTRPPRPPDPGAPASKTTPYEDFMAKPEIKAIVAAGEQSAINFKEVASYDPRSFKLVLVTGRYSIVPLPATKDAHPVEVLLTVERGKLPNEGLPRWVIASVTDANAPPSGLPH